MQVLFDRKNVIKLSGMSEKAYNRSFNALQNSLGVQTKLDIRELGLGAWAGAAYNLMLYMLASYVMRDGMIVQSGKYNELLESGLDFGALVNAHNTSMELVEMGPTMPGTSLRKSKLGNESPRNQDQVNGEKGASESPKAEKGTSKLIEDEQ